ncbi:HD domain protein [Candidatus Magnetominusculus xianensis]|uniref:HD domain protein n=2 Tax=Candidatus Magnetominusculus xianensis TaxID=1748249 RepID=A0ABR5SGD8_9BACT|nr:HD domain protein [Candidatus Magnetominusculus xianensis]
MDIKTITKIDNSLRGDFPDLFHKLERQKGITGFISILGDDYRVKTFCRYNHILRVVNLTKWLLTMFPKRDPHKSLFIAYFHDINRLPFAHNVEKIIQFNQSNNIHKYLQLCKDHIPDDYIADLQSVIEKKTHSSPESQIVYAADATEGFIEDPLFAITTLGVSADFLPQIVSNYLGFDNDREEFQYLVTYLSKLYTDNPDIFTIEFGDIVFKYASTFINKFNQNEKLFIEMPEFPEIRTALKDNFLQKLVFPINNEIVSQGKRIAKEIAIPFIEYLIDKNYDPITMLMEMTDQELLNQAVQLGLTPYHQKEYWPKLVSLTTCASIP